jgi:hypothetical protein
MQSATNQRTMGFCPHRATLRLAFATSALALLASAPSLQAQSSDSLFGRWVGTHGGRPLFFDFYDDSMLVVNDRYPVNYTHTRDSLRAYGDTSFAVQYIFSLGRLLVASRPPRAPIARNLVQRFGGREPHYSLSATRRAGAVAYSSWWLVDSR